MEQYVGLDVSLEQTSICVIDGSGKVLWQGKCASTPEAIAEKLRMRAPHAVRIGLETGPLSTWHWHALHDLGFPVICLDARQAKAALSLQLNKTDRNDAAGLAQIVRTGWYREVTVKELDSHATRVLILSRAKLVGIRVDLGNQIRGVLKTFGVVLAKATGQSFPERVRTAMTGAPAIEEVVGALLSAWLEMSRQIGVLERRILDTAREDEVVRRLMSAPGVGAIVALTFVSVIGTPDRFRRSDSVGVYVGLTPRRYQSGEMDDSGKISKCGDRLLRTYLYEAAGILLNRVERWSTLKAWGLRLTRKIGRKKATVAVARKLAVILHRMWRDGTAFRWSAKEVAA
jgi:transposase